MTETITGAEFMDMMTGNAELGKPKKKLVKRETLLSQQVKTSLDKWSAEGRFKGVYFHVPNEIQPHKMTDNQAIKFWEHRKRMGIVSGAPDWCVSWHGGHCYIELKAPASEGKKAGQLSPNQKRFRKRCDDTGVIYTVCYDIGQVEMYLIMFGGLKA